MPISRDYWFRLAQEALGAKPRTSIDQAGRIGFREICIYVIAEGPHQGTVLAHPPTAENYPSPTRGPKATAAYYSEAQNTEAFECLDDAGFWQSEAHCGKRASSIDARPGS